MLTFEEICLLTEFGEAITPSRLGIGLEVDILVNMHDGLNSKSAPVWKGVCRSSF